MDALVLFEAFAKLVCARMTVVLVQSYQLRGSAPPFAFIKRLELNLVDPVNPARYWR